MLTEDQIAQFKQEHGKIVMIQLPVSDDRPDDDPVQLVFKRASPVVWTDYQDAITKEKGTHSAAQRRLCHACRVHPEVKELEAIFREYSALPTKCAGIIQDISGVGAEFEVKKL